jgi:hypothetical protein
VKRNILSGGSPLIAKRVTDQVSLSPSSVSREMLPYGVSAPAIRFGLVGPVKYRV